MINAIIMASGLSRRMGRNKLTLPFRGKMLIEHIVDKVIECDFHNIILIAKDQEVIEAAKKRSIKAIYNENYNKGQSESIKLGIANSPYGMGYAFFTADQPLLDVETIKLLKNSFYKSKNSIIIPTFRGKKGAPVIFSEIFKHELLALSGDTGGKNIINKHPEAIQLVEVSNELALWDVDTEEEYERLIHLENINMQRDD